MRDVSSRPGRRPQPRRIASRWFGYAPTCAWFLGCHSGFAAARAPAARSKRIYSGSLSLQSISSRNWERDNRICRAITAKSLSRISFSPWLILVWIGVFLPSTQSVKNAWSLSILRKPFFARAEPGAYLPGHLQGRCRPRTPPLAGTDESVCDRRAMPYFTFPFSIVSGRIADGRSLASALDRQKCAEEPKGGADAFGRIGAAVPGLVPIAKWPNGVVTDVRSFGTRALRGCGPDG
jgi:hypothetical protein